MKRILRIPQITRSWHTWRCFGITSLFVVVAFELRMVLFDSFSSGAFIFTFYYPAIIAAGIFFGRGTALYATLLSTLFSLATILLQHAYPEQYLMEIVALAAFAGTGILIAATTELLHDENLALESARKQLMHDATTRDLLMRESMHRMRNDLSVVSTILSLQATTFEGQPAKKALSEAAARLQVMSRLQSRLDAQMQAAIVDSREYLCDLCEDIRLSLISEREVRLIVHAQRHQIEHEKAVRLGLIANELVTNAIKYGFPDNRSGQIVVSFEKSGDEYRLIVEDNGIGMPKERKHTGLGIDLVKALAGQLNGSLVFVDTEVGTKVAVTFPDT